MSTGAPHADAPTVAAVRQAVEPPRVVAAPAAPRLAVTAATPAAPPSLSNPARVLARLQTAAAQIVPQLQYQLTRLGIVGQAGLAALTAAAVIALSVLLPAHHALQALSAELAGAAHGLPASSDAQALPRFIGSLPTRTQMPAVLGQVFAQAKAAGISLDSGRYTYTAARGGSFARYELEFPIKASYPGIRSFIDRTLTAVPAASLGKLRVERKAVGDAVVNADIGFVVFVRSE